MTASGWSSGRVTPRVAVVAIDMGYGHLRAAQALACAVGTEVLQVDRPPLASASESRRWGHLRAGYELVSRSSQVPFVGRPLEVLLERITDIPNLYLAGKQTAPTAAVRLLAAGARHGLGDGLVSYLRRSDATLLTTFYAPAVVADLAGLERVVCVVTDADINRVWVSGDGAHTRIHYCSPSTRALRRLRAYGVPDEHIHLTGFPLPEELLGGTELPALRRNLAARLVRLDPAGVFREQYRDEITHFLGPLAADAAGQAPLIVFAVGGAGAQVAIARRFLPSLSTPLREGRLRLALVAGTRPEVAARFQSWVEDAGLAGLFGHGIEILCDDDFLRYYRRFNALLARADVLWTKPSELTFYAALGLPLVFARPMGVHERLNRRWAIDQGAGLKQDAPAVAGDWLEDWLEDGTLAAAAWSGFLRLPKFGTFRILELVRRLQDGTPTLQK